MSDHAAAVARAEPRPRRAGLAVVLTSAMAMATIMQFAIGALGPSLIDDLDISRTQLGVLSAVFLLVAAVLSPSVGRRIDSVDARVAIGGIFVLNGAGVLLAAVAPSFWLIMLALIPAGVASAAGNPATNRVVVALPPPHGAVTGLKQSGVQIGALVAGAALPSLAVGLGWRGALACVGAASLACLAMLPWVPAAGPAAAVRGRVTSRALDETVRRLGLYAFCMGTGMVGVTVFLPLYGTDRLGLAHTTAGALLAVIAFGGIFARVVLSMLAERRAAGGRSAGAPLPFLAATAVVASLAIAAATALGSWTLWLGAGLLGLSAAAWNGVAMLTLLRRAPAGAMGHASGRMLTAFFIGLAAGGPVFGAIVELADSYLAGWLWTAAAFAVAALNARWFLGSVD